MDPMYSSSMVYNPYGASGASSYKSSVSTDGDGGTSSMASATNGVDYDDDTGSYYVRKSAARRRKLVPSDYALDMNLHRNDEYNRASNEQRENELADQHSSQQHSSESEHSIYKAGGEDEEQDIEAGQPNDDESYDHEDDMVSWLRNRHNPMRQRRMKRQVYYESGYDGNTNCEGFPLEINVRSRIKLDRIFPIHGKSQIKKCVKIKKTLLPPMHEDSY